MSLNLAVFGIFFTVPLEFSNSAMDPFKLAWPAKFPPPKKGPENEAKDKAKEKTELVGDKPKDRDDAVDKDNEDGDDMEVDGLSTENKRKAASSCEESSDEDEEHEVPI